MRLFLRCCCAVLVLVGAAGAHANNQQGPVYQRQRAPLYQGGAGRQVGAAPRHGSKSRDKQRHGGRGHGVQSSGNWFVRPYPYHFDYYRWQYSAPPAPAAPANCPCAETPTAS